MLDLLAGGGLVAISYIAGVISGRIRRRITIDKDPDPICGCNHHLAMHDERTGRCSETVKTPSKYNGGGNAIAYEYMPCTCRRYVGPQVVETFIHPHLSLGSSAQIRVIDSASEPNNPATDAPTDSR